MNIRRGMVEEKQKLDEDGASRLPRCRVLDNGYKARLYRRRLNVGKVVNMRNPISGTAR